MVFQAARAARFAIADSWSWLRCFLADLDFLDMDLTFRQTLGFAWFVLRNWRG